MCECLLRVVISITQCSLNRFSVWDLNTRALLKVRLRRWPRVIFKFWGSSLFSALIKLSKSLNYSTHTNEGRSRGAESFLLEKVWILFYFSDLTRILKWARSWSCSVAQQVHTLLVWSIIVRYGFKSGGFCGKFPALVLMRFKSTSKDGFAVAEGRSSCSVRGRQYRKYELQAAHCRFNANIKDHADVCSLKAGIRYRSVGVLTLCKKHTEKRNLTATS